MAERNQLSCVSSYKGPNPIQESLVELGFSMPPKGANVKGLVTRVMTNLGGVESLGGRA
jgi:hypothetical protein